MEELKVDLSSIFSDLVSFSRDSYNGKQPFILKKDFKPITVINSENDEIYFFHLNYNLNLKQFKIEVSK